MSSQGDGIGERGSVDFRRPQPELAGSPALGALQVTVLFNSPNCKLITIPLRTPLPA